MDDTTAGEVVHAASQKRVIVESREESGRTPDGIHHDGVDETSQRKRVAKVGLELKKRDVEGGVFKTWQCGWR